MKKTERKTILQTPTQTAQSIRLNLPKKKFKFMKNSQFSIFFFLLTMILNGKMILKIIINSEFNEKNCVFIIVLLASQIIMTILIFINQKYNKKSPKAQNIIKFSILIMAWIFQEISLFIFENNWRENYEVETLDHLYWDSKIVVLYGFTLFKMIPVKIKQYAIAIIYFFPLIYLNLDFKGHIEVILSIISFIQIFIFFWIINKNFFNQENNDETNYREISEFFSEGYMIVSKNDHNIIFSSPKLSKLFFKLRKIKNIEEMNQCFLYFEEQKVMIENEKDQESIYSSIHKLNYSSSQSFTKRNKYKTKTFLMNLSKNNNKSKFDNIKEILASCDETFELFLHKNVVRTYSAYQANEVKELSIKNVLYKNKFAYLISVNKGNQINILPKLTKENDFQSRLLSSFSHEMRTPLNGSIPVLEDVLDELNSSSDGKSEKLKEHIYSALGSLKILENTINDIIDFQALMSGEFYLNIQEIDLLSVLNDVTKLMKIQAQKKGLDFFSNLDLEIPEKILSDSNRIKQILVNLLSNAIKFTKTGFIELSANLIRENPEFLIEIKIKDTGMGIDEGKLSKLKKILTNFQLENIQFLETTGCSFGMILSQNLALALGDEKSEGLIVDTKLNQGSCFTFYIIDRIDQKELLDILDSRAISINRIPEKITEKSSSLRCETKSISRKSMNAISPQLKKLRENTYSTIKREILSMVDDFYEAEEDSQTPHHYVSEKMSALTNNMNREKMFIDLKPSCFSPLKSKTKPEKTYPSTGLHNSIPYETQGSVPVECMCNKVLIVDDCIFNINTMELLLSKEGVKCDSAFDGFEAIEMFKNKFIFKTTSCGSKCLGYKLILMDYQMPKKDGVEASIELQSIMKEHKIPEVPIICCTAFDSNTLVAKCFQAGMKEVIFKPVNLSFLKNVLKKWYKPF